MYCIQPFYTNYRTCFVGLENSSKIIPSFVLVRRKQQTSKMSKFFTCKHKINESNAKVPHIIELLACTCKILAIMFYFPINYLISLGTC